MVRTWGHFHPLPGPVASRVSVLPLRLLGALRMKLVTTWRMEVARSGGATRGVRACWSPKTRCSKPNHTVTGFGPPRAASPASPRSPRLVHSCHTWPGECKAPKPRQRHSAGAKASSDWGSLCPIQSPICEEHQASKRGGSQRPTDLRKVKERKKGLNEKVPKRKQEKEKEAKRLDYVQDRLTCV